MLHLVKTDRTYDPETISVMTTAFETVCRSVSAQSKNDEDIRETLALIILRHIDQGERDAQRLSMLAASEFASTGRSAAK